MPRALYDALRGSYDLCPAPGIKPQPVTTLEAP